MANPQREDGHVDIANEIVEHLARYRLSGQEWQVIWVILRKTWGWHKKKDRLSLGYIAKTTLIKRPAIARIIKKLLNKGVIKKDNSYINIYMFNKDYETWKSVTKKDNTFKVLPKKITGVTKKDNKGVTNIDTTTKETTKETITKEKGSDFKKAWKDFKEMRKKIKKPMTEKAEEMLFNSLNKLSKDKKEQVAILNQSIFHCWQGVFPLKERPQDNENQPKYIPKKAPKLTAEQIAKNKKRVTELVKGFKNKFDIPQAGGESGEKGG